jgi:seryl-tRNA synthetase
MAEMQKLKDAVVPLKAEADRLRGERDALLNTIGNLLDPRVPDGEDEHTCNRVETTWGEVPEMTINGKALGHEYHH